MMDKFYKFLAVSSLVVFTVWAVSEAVQGNPHAAHGYVCAAGWAVLFLVMREPDDRPVYIPTVPDWISVDDRLPYDELDRYVANHDEFPGFIVMIKDATEPTRLYFDGEKWYDENEYTYTVTHWMNMPEPPVQVSEREGVNDG